MTDSTPVAATDGPPETSRAARQPAGAAPSNLTAVVAANFTNALPYILVPVLFLLSVIFISGYFSKASIISLLILASLLGLSSLGQTMTIIAGGIDLSIPAVIGLSDIIVTQLYYKHWSLPVIFLAIAGLAILIGTISAVASVLLRVHSLITTFGMSLIVSGVALEWGMHGIRANTVSPGYTMTPMTAEKLEKNRESMMATIPLRRVAQPDEIANMVVWCCSDRASYVTGVTYNVDGGYMAT